MRTILSLCILLLALNANSYAANSFEQQYKSISSRKCTATEETHGQQAPWVCMERQLKELETLRSKLVKHIFSEVESKGVASDKQRNINTTKSFISSWEKYSADTNEFANVFYDCGTMCTDFKYFTKIRILSDHVETLIEFIGE